MLWIFAFGCERWLWFGCVMDLCKSLFRLLGVLGVLVLSVLKGGFVRRVEKCESVRGE